MIKECGAPGASHVAAREPAREGPAGPSLDGLSVSGEGAPSLGVSDEEEASVVSEEISEEDVPFLAAQAESARLYTPTNPGRYSLELPRAAARRLRADDAKVWETPTGAAL